MSSDKYAQHLIQKYRLAIAIAVIQTTPETKTLDQHLIDLKNKYNDEIMDDHDITICSEDFEVDFNENDLNVHNVSHNSDTILKDFNHTNITGNFVLEIKNNEVFPVVLDIVQNIDNECGQDKNNNNDIQSTFCETQTQHDSCLALESLTDIDKTFCDRIARIHHDNVMDIDKTCDDIVKIYKITDNVNDKQTFKITEQTISNAVETNKERNNVANFNSIRENNEISTIKDTNPSVIRQYLEGTTFDSQATELYTLQFHTQNYTHVSQSQNENINIPDKFVKGINKSSGNISKNTIYMNTELSCVKDVNLVRKINNYLEKENYDVQGTHNFNHNTPTARDHKENDDQISQIQVSNTAIDYNSEYVLPQHFKDDKLVRKVLNNLEQDVAINNVPHNTPLNLNTHKDYRINDDNLKETQVFSVPMNDDTENYSQDSNIYNAQNTEFETYTQNTAVLNESSKNNIENATMQVFNYSQNAQNVTKTTVHKITIDEENYSDGSEEMSQTELVPFKVMEELNRVKAYLNRRVERRLSNESSLDSGYRSDSQGRSSQRSRSGFQLSDNWVGQSGYCLFDHLTRCPLVSTTEEIVAEISEVLGQLIDRLHDQESYPSFLEELLDHVGSLIRCVFSGDDMLLDKDETTQRLFLLNKSIHIQKYSIEKLSDILETMHARFTHTQDLYELTNIQETENLSYIFHILEVILKGSLKYRKIYNSQSLSQEQDKHKRSSISDIWRRKWNPNYKEAMKLDSDVVKTCVFEKCTVILNKMIVGCMDGYSLVAFAALQCFNLLQS